MPDHRYFINLSRVTYKQNFAIMSTFSLRYIKIDYSLHTYFRHGLQNRLCMTPYGYDHLFSRSDYGQICKFYS